MQAISIRALAVFCGSKDGVNPLFRTHAIELGRIMAERQVTLVYGGGNVGLMGCIADTVMEAGGRAVGVIPKVLIEWERQHNSLSELLVVEDMHARKRKMYELCDAAIVLPGGFGTLDEFFEMLTWNQLAIHDKHIYILDSGGFYRHMIAHINSMREENFLYEAAHRRLTVLQRPADLIPHL